jgi:polysaccharide pyruvyl transferase WcaK-like protein
MPRILCLGAFANGNLGDMYQADAVARLLQEVDPAVEVASASPSKRQSAYPARYHQAGPTGGALDPDYVNGFDLLLIGGGGLLSAPHMPLNDPKWVANVTIPICTVSVGAVADTAEVCRPFIEKCALMSVRDEFSHAAVAAIRPDSRIVMDPILLDAAGRAEPPAPRRAGVTWVPGKLVSGTEELWAGAIRRMFDRNRDHLISFNPVTDQNSGFDQVFSNVRYLEDVETFLDTIGSSRLVVSERYHACIYALVSGIPAVGVCLRSRAVTSKIEELYRKLGCENALIRQPFSEDRAALIAMGDAIDFDVVRQRLSDERTRLLGYLGECLALV